MALSLPLLYAAARPYILPAIEGNVMLDRQVISLFAGDDHLQPFVVFQPGTQTPQDVTGWTFTFYVKQEAEIADQFALLTLPGVITAASQGQGQVHFRAADTLGLHGTYTFQLKALDTLGNTQHIAAGVMEIAVT